MTPKNEIEIVRKPSPAAKTALVGALAEAVEAAQQEAAHYRRLAEEGPLVYEVFVVDDAGPGVPPAERDAVFERFAGMMAKG